MLHARVGHWQPEIERGTSEFQSTTLLPKVQPPAQLAKAVVGSSNSTCGPAATSRVLPRVGVGYIDLVLNSALLHRDVTAHVL